MVTLLSVVVKAQFGILSLAELALVSCFLVNLHQHCSMAVNRHFEAQLAEELHVNRQGHEPFLTTYNMGGAHEVIVNYMGEVICRDTVCLENDGILIVSGHGYFAANSIHDFEVACVSVGFKSYYIRLAGADIRLNLFIGEITVLFCVFAVDTGGFLGGFLLSSDICYFLL